MRVVWAGYSLTFFTAANGVKQGGVLSPILFCIYMDDLHVKLSQCGVGCFIGAQFVGALAFADDIVLLAPSPSAIRKLLFVSRMLLILMFCLMPVSQILSSLLQRVSVI